MRRKKAAHPSVCFPAVLAGAVGFLVFLSVPGTALAGSLTDFAQDAGHLYSRFDLANYDLDFYVDNSWSWLPWNWTDAIGRSVLYGVYILTNFIWYLSRLISTATGMIVSEAYRLDLLNEAADTIGENIQKLAGVSPSGISTDGFYPGFLALILLVLGVYAAYAGLCKREASRAIGAVAKTMVLFILTTAIIVYAPQGIRDINDLSNDVSNGSLRLGTGIVMPGNDEGDSVELIRDNLFMIQVYEPWLLLQWGTTDTAQIGQDRIDSLLGISPDEQYGDTRAEAVKNEIETYGNVRLSVTKVAVRLAETVFLSLINLVISIFVIILCAMMIFTQVLFIFFALFMVLSFVLSMFPECGSLFGKAVLNIINIVLLRAGYTLLLTAAFSVSTMIYSLSQGHSFLLTGFLQIVTFAGVFFSKNELFQMMMLSENNATRRIGAIGTLLAYSKARRGAQTMRNARNKVIEKAAGAGKAVAGAGIHGVKYATGKVKNAADRAMDRNLDELKASRERREQAGQEAASWSDYQRQRKEEKEKLHKSYPVAEKSPGIQNAGFYARKKTAKKERYWKERDGDLAKYDTLVEVPEEPQKINYVGTKVEKAGRYNRIKLQKRRENTDFYNAEKEKTQRMAESAGAETKEKTATPLKNVKEKIKGQGAYNRITRTQKIRKSIFKRRELPYQETIPVQKKMPENQSMQKQNGILQQKSAEKRAVRKAPKMKKAVFYRMAENSQTKPAGNETEAGKVKNTAPKNLMEKWQEGGRYNRIARTWKNRKNVPDRKEVPGQKTEPVQIGISEQESLTGHKPPKVKKAVFYRMEKNGQAKPAGNEMEAGKVTNAAPKNLKEKSQEEGRYNRIAGAWKNRRSIPDRKGIPERKDAPGQKEMPGRKEMLEQKKISGRKDITERKEMHGQKDMPERKEMPGRKDVPERKEMPGQKDMSGQNKMPQRESPEKIIADRPPKIKNAGFYSGTKNIPQQKSVPASEEKENLPETESTKEMQSLKHVPAGQNIQKQSVEVRKSHNEQIRNGTDARSDRRQPESMKEEKEWRQTRKNMAGRRKIKGQPEDGQRGEGVKNRH